jgi:GDPmannose 4,6-dehydratase
LQLGNLDIWRDWGWAPEYVEAMHLMLQPEQPRDYVIASGTSHSLGEFAAAAFEQADLVAAENMDTSEALMRPSDISYSAMNPSRISQDLGWRHQHGLKEIVERMYTNSYQ